MVEISVNSGFDRSQEVPDNAPVSAYMEAMAAVGSSDRSRRAQNRSGPTSQLQTRQGQSDGVSVPSQEEAEAGDASSKEDDTDSA